MSSNKINSSLVTKLIKDNIRKDKSIQEKNKVIELLCARLRERSEVNV